MFQVDLIVVSRPGTTAWVNAIGMDRIDNCGSSCQWNPDTYTLNFERTITRISGNNLTLNIPMVQSLDSRFGGGTVQRCRDRRITRAGVEHLIIKSSYDPTILSFHADGSSYPSDEAHASTAVAFQAVVNGWALNITCMHMSFACVNIGRAGKHVTVAHAKSLDPVSVITGAKRYAFNVDGQHNLVVDCTSDKSRHAFVTGRMSLGPNVFLRCSSTNDYSGIGPHHRPTDGP